MRTSAWSRRAIELIPIDAPLRVVGDDDEPPAGLDEGPVGLRLQQVGGGEPGLLVHAVDADEHEVHDGRVRRAATANGPTSASDGVR